MKAVTLIFSILAAACCALPCPAQMRLEGRIEAIAGPNAKLPIEMTVRSLKPATAQIDPNAPQPKVTYLPSYPEYLLGRWGGELQVVFNSVAPGHYQERVRAKGQPALVIFDFVKRRNEVELRPATILYQSEKWTRAMREQMMRPEDKDAYLKELKLLPKPPSPNDILAYHPVIDLAGTTFSSLEGKESLTQKAVYNTLVSAERGKVEQDVVLAVTSGGKNLGYQETVIRFTWYSRSQVWVQVAYAAYELDRQPFSRTVLQGWITPNWHKTAEKMVAWKQAENWESIAGQFLH